MDSAWLMNVLAPILGLPIIAMAILWSLVPKQPHLELTSWPSVLWIFAQVLISCISKGKAPAKRDGRREKQLLEVSLVQPVAFKPSTLRAFRALVRHDRLPYGEVPVMYPIVESFRLCIQAMLLPQFPVNVLGSVLARNRMELYRALSPSEKLVYRVEVDTTPRLHPKGHLEFDLISSAHTVEDLAAGSVTRVWRSTLTVIVLSGKKGASSTPAQTEQAPASTEPRPQRTQIAEWHLGGDVGRKYGWLNGDLNPIHLYPATSALFGFKRPIAHALFLVAKAEASMRNSGAPPAYPLVLQSEFKRPTLLPAKLAVMWQLGDPSTTPAAAAASPGGLPFAVVTTDPEAKEVLVGRLVQGEAARADIAAAQQ
mmetsp:Transcript_35611/g.79151  ORF Transcript_35611/g.79151 Transcript_35611/m.79151 type:complete len:369 (-) Transcript_35611:650-1756(-)|eukprot:CAMPEP_0202906742 /NCGR_PEP_ID=MMETSP1392-20130828/40164_1 /ASSEMBLY_ACC=CAM_ASM_000868 /TAXON_ID=225041 /ORGANISM="Chlamydomonas chlamydogama, Strain SAG 11-48b" /LENGTH=368 /DNA_ID=CAMNT_0049595377 /DNA_START=124 /DNA_END=1230 /DNA_ORIENTATION=-